MGITHVCVQRGISEMEQRKEGANYMMEMQIQ